MVTNSDNDPLRSVAAGVTDSVIEKSGKGIKGLVQKFLDGKLAFIQERETIDRVREQLKNNEHRFYQTYIKEKEILRFILIGLSMRRLDEEGEKERREDLCKKILKHHGKEKLHIAYLVQNKILMRYIILVLETVQEPSLLQKKLNSFLKNIEKHVYFIRNTQKTEQVADTIKTKITTFNPEVFIVSGMGAAKKIALASFSSLKDLLEEDYEYEEYNSKQSMTIILNNFNQVNI